MLRQKPKISLLYFLGVLLLLSVASSTPCLYGCQAGYSEWYSGTCYEYVATSQSQSAAVTTCSNEGATLLVVDSNAEQVAIQSHVTTPAWMGITFIFLFGWQKPSGGGLSYTNWISPTPNGFLQPYQPYAFIDPSSSYKWAGGTSSDSKSAVCEASCLPAPTTTTTSTTLVTTTSTTLATTTSTALVLITTPPLALPTVTVLPGGCSSNPCVNGNCTNGILPGLFTCACPAGYTGTTCDKDINECASSPCQNSGQCNEGFNGYNCTCLAAFSGTNCEVKLTTCVLQTSAEQKQRIGMFASQSVSSITLLVIIGILIIIFLVLLEFSLERVFHMGQEISLWLAQITILFARTRTVLDSGAFCNDQASSNPPTLNNAECGMVAVWLHYLYLVHFLSLFMEALHNYTIYTYVFVRNPMLKRKFVLLIGLLGPIPIVALTAAVWFNDYVTEQTCWLNFSSVNFFIEIVPVIIMCAVGEICAEATGMIEYAPNLLATEEKRTSANTNSKGSVFIIPISFSAWILGMDAVFATSLSLYTTVAVLNIILAILMLLFHTLGNAKARWLLWKIFCSWCPKQKPRPKPTSSTPGQIMNQGNGSDHGSGEDTSFNGGSGEPSSFIDNNFSSLDSSGKSSHFERKSSLIAIVEDAHRRVNQISPSR